MSTSGGTTGGTTGVLATKQYAPASQASYAVNSATLAALDTTNLTLAFTVPSNGIVDVWTEIAAVAGTSHNFGVGLLNHTGGAQVGFTATINDITTASRYRVTWHLTGLTPGALQLDLAASAVSSATFAAIGYTGNVTDANVSPAILQAVASV